MSDLYHKTFEIKQLPKRYNQGMGSHWKARYGEAKKWKALIRTVTIGSKPRYPLERAEVTCVRHSSVCPDFENLCQSFKTCIDALVWCGILKDDSMKVIGRPIYEWAYAKPKQGKITITIREVKE